MFVFSVLLSRLQFLSIDSSILRLKTSAMNHFLTILIMCNCHWFTCRVCAQSSPLWHIPSSKRINSTGKRVVLLVSSIKTFESEITVVLSFRTKAWWMISFKWKCFKKGNFAVFFFLWKQDISFFRWIARNFGRKNPQIQTPVQNLYLWVPVTLYVLSFCLV